MPGPRILTREDLLAMGMRFKDPKSQEAQKPERSLKIHVDTSEVESAEVAIERLGEKLVRLEQKATAALQRLTELRALVEEVEASDARH